MFCSGCGKEIPEGSKFCPGCGKATDGVPNVTNVVSDSTKILKEGEFRRVEKAMEALSRKNDGKLTLFCDRVEWRGRVSEDIKITDIVKVAAGSIRKYRVCKLLLSQIVYLKRAIFAM